MPVDRVLYQCTLTAEVSPNWPCPSCGGGHYRLVKDSLKSSWTASTNKVRKEYWFGPDNVEMRFVAFLECDNPKCREPATVAGKGFVYEVYAEDDRAYVDKFSPQYFSPSPPLIRIPARCPKQVSERLDEAFVASWGDYDAAGNRIRCAIEALLDTLDVKQAKLHQRIVSMPEKYANVQKELLAIKWLGNAASHGNSLTRGDVFDALDIFEHVLDALFDDRKENLQRLVEGINDSKGPSRRLS